LALGAGERGVLEANFRSRALTSKVASYRFAMAYNHSAQLAGGPSQ